MWSFLLVLACAAPCPSLAPAALVIEQLDLGSRAIGEAALLRGPDGTAVLIDVGNDSHEDDVAEALERHGLRGVDHVVVTHADEDHMGGLDKLLDAAPVPPQVHRWDTVSLPTTIPLGVGATLARGRLALDDGSVVVLAEPEDDNARSIGGIVTYGAFSYLFAGDLPGGGKGTQDLEGAVVAHADRLPWIPADGVTVLQLNHHGISSSTSPAWADWLRPEHAVVGANGAYLDAPSAEALAALAPWGTQVWVTEDGLLGNRDEHTTVAHGPVSVRVEAGGNAFTVGPACPDQAD